MPSTGTVRRRPVAVLVVGPVEPEVPAWLRGEGHTVTAAATAKAALRGLDAAPADLVVVGGDDVAGACRTLHADGRLADAWLLAIARRGRADAALRAGADDYVHRPFTRGELLARARAGLRAVRHRADDALVGALMANVPGAIYRSAWHAGHRLELVSDEIERISGYPPVNFIASERRTLLSLVHPDDRERVEQAVADATAGDDAGAFALEYRIVCADGAVRWVLDAGQLVRGPGDRLWLDGALLDVTERRAAEETRRHDEVQAARTEELRASRVRIVEAADAARRRIERDLHDGAQQRLVALGIQVRMAQARYTKDPASAGPFLDALGAELAEASAELRELARGIHPAVLTDRGLGPAIEALAGRAPFPVELLEVPGERLPSAVETTAYFTVAEALTNVAKYAQASHASVRLAREDGALVVEVRDDGVGGADPTAGTGLTGLVDRVEACDGTLSVASPPGAGTLVRAVLPA